MALAWWYSIGSKCPGIEESVYIFLLRKNSFFSALIKKRMSLNSDSDIADTYEEDITQSESANETSQLESDSEVSADRDTE